MSESESLSIADRLASAMRAAMREKELNSAEDLARMIHRDNGAAAASLATVMQRILEGGAYPEEVAMFAVVSSSRGQLL